MKLRVLKAPAWPLEALLDGPAYPTPLKLQNTHIEKHVLAFSFFGRRSSGEALPDFLTISADEGPTTDLKSCPTRSKKIPK